LSTAILGFANTPCFQFQIEDLPLKYRILWEDFKNKITGRSRCQMLQCLWDQIPAFSSVLNVEPHRLKPVAFCEGG